MNHPEISAFLAEKRYPKFFWESPEGNSALIGIGHSSEIRFPRFFCSTFFSPNLCYFNPERQKEITFVGSDGYAPLPRFFERVDLPDFSGWKENVEKALEKIAAGTLDKVVLARKTILTFPKALDPFAILFLLRKNARNSSTLFCFQLDVHHAFLGATPEKLFTREDRKLKTMALAGTRKRGSDPNEDAKLSQELLLSGKDRREVDVVVEFMMKSLSPLADSIEVDPLEILKTPHLQHLHYPIHALLKGGILDERLIQALHPTPALGGSPRKEALEFIKHHEPFTRGWYGAPIGWLGPEKSDVAVAIRSAWVDGNKLHLYAGTGIVEGSDPRAEWEELEHKISPFLQ